MRAIKATAISTLAVGLLASSAVGTAAQEDGGPRVAPTVFEITNPGPNGDDPGGEFVEFDGGLQLYGAVRPDHRISAGDPRASGRWTRVQNADFYGASGNATVVETEAHRIENADGAWHGTGLDFGEITGGEAASLGRYAVLTGDGAYAGLALVMIETGDSWLGMIVPTAQIPPSPELPAE